MKINKKLNQGNTLVELLLYMMLLSIFLLALFNLFTMIISTQTRSTAVFLVQTNGNYLLAKLVYDVNQSDIIVSPLNVGATATSMTLINGVTTNIYSVNNGRLNLNNGSAVYGLNDADTGISNFTVRRLEGKPGGKNGLQLSFTITSLVTDNTSTKSADFSTTAVIR